MLRATQAALVSLAEDDRVARRLALAPIVFELVLDDEQGNLTCSLGRVPIEVSIGNSAEPAPIRLYLSARQLHDFWRGELKPALEIMRGQIRYEGPVRGLLRVLPIVSTASNQYFLALGDAAAVDDQAP